MDNNNSIVAIQFNDVKILTRESDGWVNLTEMCKVYDARLDNWMRLKSSKTEMASIVNSLRLNSLTTEVESSNPYSAIIETKGGRKGGTWGHPLLAVRIARWVNLPLADWLDAHSLVLMTDGKTSLDIDPFERMQEIFADLRLDLDDSNSIDDRFYDIEAYPSWSIESGN
jgi:hypothetical protein